MSKDPPLIMFIKFLEVECNKLKNKRVEKSECELSLSKPMGNMILLVLTCLWKEWKDANIMRKKGVL
jgi:hypothetical protein